MWRAISRQAGVTGAARAFCAFDGAGLILSAFAGAVGAWQAQTVASRWLLSRISSRFHPSAHHRAAKALGASRCAPNRHGRMDMPALASAAGINLQVVKQTDVAFGFDFIDRCQ